MTEQKSETVGKPRGFQVDPEAGQMVVRGLSAEAIVEALSGLLEENPEMSLEEAVKEIRRRQQQAEKKESKNA